MILIVGISFVICCIACGTALALKRHVGRVGCTPRVLLRALDQKLWMTFWLGFFFIALYLAMNIAASQVYSFSHFINAMKVGARHPGLFFYWAGFTVMFNSLLILLVRQVIKYFYFSLRR